MSPFIVLRPEPGNARTAARLVAAGGTVIRLPLFAIRPVAWRLPDMAGIDALLFTSANAPRHGGDGLAAVRHLRVIAVGAATAEAARIAGFEIAATGEQDVAAAVTLATAAGFARLLHLAGRDRASVTTANVTAITVYAADAVPIDGAAMVACRGGVALLHSTRAAARFAALCDPATRADIAIAAIGPAVATAAGPGWRAVRAAAVPTEDALIDGAMTLAH